MPTYVIDSFPAISVYWSLLIGVLYAGDCSQGSCEHGDDGEGRLRGVTLRILKHVDFWALVSVAILEVTGLPVVFFFSHK